MADELRILVDRRRFLGLGGAGVAALVLAGCGGDGGGDGRTQVTAPPVAKAPTNLEGALNIYTWADYQNPDNVKNFSKANKNLKVKIDVYDSNEAAIAKLELSGAKAGYDIVVPTGVYIPQMVAKGLLQPLDKSKLPNFAKLDPKLLNQPWDPGNRYSAVKDWGSTGYVYDKTLVTEPLSDWAGFFRAAAAKGVSGKVAVLDAPADVTGLAFWREGIDWNTTNPADFQRAEQILTGELVPHLKAFNSFPRDGLLNGEYALAQMWNGDARQVLLEDPDRFAWVLGAPKTELWVDNWTILKSAQHPQAAYAWINNVLDPRVSAAEIDYHGYNTAVIGTEEFLPKDLRQKELIYFTEDEKARFVPGSVANQDQVTRLYNKLKAAASK
ncbi:MAG TPA: spermidine/putrescine ABC transporter substrate-binding protein [Actinomycetes bacterium]|nr:spermidine/putrescine ABC transporter substrate-binding protein [Actinomycetes bacterium]